MRTDAEIVERLKLVEPGDWLGTQTGDLVAFLPFEAARSFLANGVTAADWENLPKRRDPDSIKAAMLEYMPFAWDKANNCRGISAGRSLDHMSVWLWMLGREEAALQIREYTHYGKPQLRAICEEFGWDWRQWDSDTWQAREMDDGLSAPESVEPLARERDA